MKVGIIGSGFGLYGLLPAFNSIPKCQVVSICGKRTDRLINYCQSIGLKKIYTEWQEMLEKEDLDAIAIAVTPNAQYKITKTAIKMGLDIFAEKPLAKNYKQAKELLVLAKKNKIITTVDFIFPEINEWQKVKEILSDKVYGELRHISVDWRFLSYDIKNRISSWKTDVSEGGGALSFYLSHTLYYLEYYGGEISGVKSNFSYSKGINNGGETGVELLLKFKNGVSGQVHFSCDTSGINKHQLIFTCEKAVLVLENYKDVTKSFFLTVYPTKGVKNILVKKGLKKADEDERVTVVKKLASRFVNGSLSGIQITPSFIDGVRVQELIDKIRKNVTQ